MTAPLFRLFFVEVVQSINHSEILILKLWTQFKTTWYLAILVIFLYVTNIDTKSLPEVVLYCLFALYRGKGLLK